MKKRIVSVFLVAAILSALVATAAAAQSRAADYTPSLTFDGTTANCTISIMAIGKPITATLELWQGSTRVAKWSDSATSRLIIDEDCTRDQRPDLHPESQRNHQRRFLYGNPGHGDVLNSLDTPHQFAQSFRKGE